MLMPEWRKPAAKEWQGTLLGFGFTGLPWAHLLADRDAGGIDPWIDRALVIIVLFGVSILVNRFAPDTWNPVIRLAGAIRGRRGFTGEQPTGGVK